MTNFTNKLCGQKIPDDLNSIFRSHITNHRQVRIWVSTDHFGNLSPLLAIEFLAQGREELQELAKLHGLSDEVILSCGAKVSWESKESVSAKKQSKGETLFGALGNILYRDRGFATPKPVTAKYYFSNPQTLCLRTEYNDSVFEEELKLVGKNYRTRQSIISRAEEQLMIGQYLEKRI